MNVTSSQNINDGITLGAVGAGVGGIASAISQGSQIKEIKKTAKDEFVRCAEEVAKEKKLSRLPDYMASKGAFVNFLKKNKIKVIGKCAGIGLAVGVALSAIKSILVNRRNNELLMQQLMMQNAQLVPSQQLNQQPMMNNNQMIPQQAQIPQQAPQVQQTQEITPEQLETLRQKAQ